MWNDAIGIRLRCYDTVDPDANVYVRKIVVRNLRDEKFEVMLHHEFVLYGNAVGTRSCTTHNRAGSCSTRSVVTRRSAAKPASTRAVAAHDMGRRFRLVARHYQRTREAAVELANLFNEQIAGHVAGGRR